MRTVIFLFIILIKLISWDFKFRMLRLVSKNVVVNHLNRWVFRYARILINFARYIAGLNVVTSNNLKEKLPNTFLLVSNHQSLADIALLMSEFKRHSLRFVAKKSLERGVPAVSQTLRYQKHALINRKGDFFEAMNSLKRLSERIQPKICPVVFPEGTRSRSGELGTFYSGAVKSILKNRPLPTVCVAIDGGYKISGTKDLLDNMKHITYRMEIVSIYEEPKSRKDIGNILEKCHQDIEKKLKDWRRKE
jgi:1-acyl-sn-glycerol-3-phosphate acyltransferase